DAVLRTANTALFDALRVERAADDMITHTGQILHTTTTHQHDRVLLKVVTLVRNVGDDLVAIGQTDLGDFAHRRVRLLGRAGHDLEADTTAEGGILKSRRFALVLHLRAPFADELINGRHCDFS